MRIVKFKVVILGLGYDGLKNVDCRDDSFRKLVRFRSLQESAQLFFRVSSLSCVVSCSFKT